MIDDVEDIFELTPTKEGIVMNPKARRLELDREIGRHVSAFWWVGGSILPRPETTSELRFTSGGALFVGLTHAHAVPSRRRYKAKKDGSWAKDEKQWLRDTVYASKPRLLTYSAATNRVSLDPQGTPVLESSPTKQTKTLRSKVWCSSIPPDSPLTPLPSAALCFL